jgi:dolichol-phosphate mannosyltransferase
VSIQRDEQFDACDRLHLGWLADRAHPRTWTIPDDHSTPTGTRRHRRPRIRRLLRSLLSPSKFAIVGIIGIFVNQAALFGLTEGLAIHYAWSAVLASQLSTLNNFLLTELWVFADREHRSHVLFRYLVFNLLNISTLTIRVPVLLLLTELAGVHYLVSNLVAIGLTFGIRYLVADNWIWAGRDRWDQRAVDGWFNYDIQGLIRLRSTVALPELATFNVRETLEPDIVVRRRWLGGRPRARVAVLTEPDGTLRYREHLGPLSAAFDLRTDGPIELDANWLLIWSHHVLYTNMVEPVLRFLLVTRGHVLLHCAAIDADRGAIVLSAETDTGKTSTVLQLLMRRSWGFIADDMAIVAPSGEILAYPKPMTLSSHTMSAVNDRALPFADRMMLAIRSRLHSREGRSIGHALGRLNVPIVTINAWVQLFIPPPKYHVGSLIDCDMSERAPIDAIVLMERGRPVLAEEPTPEFTLDRLIANTDNAYTFPPFADFAPRLRLGDMDYPALRARERELLATAIASARRLRLRVEGHSWADVIPDLLDRPSLPPAKQPVREGSVEREPVAVPLSRHAKTSPGAEQAR